MKSFLLFLIVCILSIGQFTQAEQSTLPEYGKKKADTYFIERKKRSAQNTVVVPEDPYVHKTPAQQQQPKKHYNPVQVNYNNAPHVMAVQLGFYLDDKSHRWGKKSTDEDVGQWNLGVTYLIGEWMNSMDLYFRGELQGFKVDTENANKISMSGVVTFPDIRSGFPVYFGAGLGMGIFFDQIDDESHLSFDYQLLMGIRLLDLYEGIGFIAEVGAKNHIFLTSKGQFNGYFLSLGSVFRF